MIDEKTLARSSHCCYLFICFFALIFAPLVNAEEMDWDKNGTVTFKEFLFAFTRWVGIDNEDDDEDDEEAA